MPGKNEALRRIKNAFMVLYIPTYITGKNGKEYSPSLLLYTMEPQESIAPGKHTQSIAYDGMVKLCFFD
jgi:hypothetical protein